MIAIKVKKNKCLMYSEAINLDRPLKDNGQWMSTVKIFTTT